jgi:L-iditol 2-dehydrogenase
VTARGVVEIIELDPPQLEVDRAIVRPEILSICGSDLKVLYTLPDAAYPLAIGESGHEVLGVVEEVAYSSKVVSPLEPGQRVLAVPAPHVAVAELFMTSPSMLHRVPDHPSEEMVMAQPLATVIGGVLRLAPVNGRSVVVIGQGGIGLLFDTMLRRMGARRIVGVDLSAARRAAAGRFGATAVVDGAAADVVEQVRDALGGGWADAVVDASGEPEAINLCPKVVKAHGEILFFGGPKQRHFDFDFSGFHSKTPTVLFSAVDGKPMFELAIDLIARGEVDVSGMITHRFPLERAAEAFEMAQNRSAGALRVAVDF